MTKELLMTNDKNEQEGRWDKWYRETLKELRSDGFEPTPAEAVYLRKIVRDCLMEGDRGGDIWAYPEIFERFFWNYFGINLQEYNEWNEKERRELFRYIQTKLRRDRELI